MKKIIKMVMILCVGIFVGTILMLGVNLLPNSIMEKHLKQSAIVMEKETDYYETVPGKISSRLDNFTDSIMLVSSVYKADTGLVDRAMNVYRVIYEDKSPAESLISYVNGEEGFKNISYARYWHGYQVILKPLLIFFNYQEIRYINMFVQILFLTMIAVQLVKKRMKWMILPYSVTIFSLMPVSVALSLQFSTIFYVTNVAILLLLSQYEKMKKNEWIGLFFLLIGMCTSFVDFLTYPLVSLGIPLILLLALDKTDKFITALYGIVKYVFCWGIGYIGMWGGKWIVGSLLLKRNIIEDAINTASTRTASKTATVQFSHLDVLWKNIYAMFSSPIRYIIFAILIICIVLMFRNMLKDKKNYFIRWQYMIIACMPIIWYLVLANHSYIHFWFTYRELAVSIFAVLSWGMLNVCVRTGEEHEKKYS